MARATAAPTAPAPFASEASLPLRALWGALLAVVLALPAVGTMAANLFLTKQWLPLSVRLNLVAGVWLLNTLNAALIIGVVALGFALLKRWPLQPLAPSPGRPGPSLRPGSSPFTRNLALVVLALCAALIGVVYGALMWQLGGPGLAFDPMLLPYALQTNLMIAGLLVAAREYASRSSDSARALHESGLRRLALDAELSAARLRVLQAQVEPHFLFNSLANLRRLVRTDRDGARSMIGALLRYLEEALPRLREERTTLEREAELVRAYLAVHQVRMGERLQVHIDVPPNLGRLELPPMLLLTLVENAIKHGLQPLVEGGSIHVAARVLDSDAGHRLHLSVADTGRGMGNASGTGTGLANLRARLKAIHGNQAQLALHMNEPRGVVASINLPVLDAALLSPQGSAAIGAGDGTAAAATAGAGAVAADATAAAPPAGLADATTRPAGSKRADFTPQGHAKP